METIEYISTTEPKHSVYSQYILSHSWDKYSEQVNHSMFHYIQLSSLFETSLQVLHRCSGSLVGLMATKSHACYLLGDAG